jgi:DNA modification methylase
MNRVIHGDCLKVMATFDNDSFHCAFTDVPDNIGRDYNEYDDNKELTEYLQFIDDAVVEMCRLAPIVCVSFNSKWTLEFGDIFRAIRNMYDLEFKPCVQTFTFGVQQQKDLKNCHRPLWRLRRKDAPLYPDQAREASWRLLNGDKRANPKGAVPGDWFNTEVMVDTVFDVPRVVGNSKQKRAWHDNQLNELLVERWLKHTTAAGDYVLDPFGGTGTTLRVGKRLDRSVTTCDVDSLYCKNMAKENGLKVLKVA